jgi:outer membrane receptor protein involved in Fe transport
VADLRLYDPETLWNVELGYKAKLFGERLDLRAAVFRMQRDDIQISTSTERPIPGSNAVEFIEYTGNAAEGFNQGIEAELTFAATDRLSLFANVGWLDTEFENYIDNSGRDLDGREQAHAPSYQFFAGAQLQITQAWTARIELEGKDEYFFSNSHAAKSEAYELINASVGYSSERFSARLWGRNLADEDYFVRGFFFGNDPRDFYTARPFTQLGEPRQYGLTVQVNW